MISGLTIDNNDDDSHGDSDNLNRETIITTGSAAETETKWREKRPAPRKSRKQTVSFVPSSHQQQNMLLGFAAREFGVFCD